MTFKWSRFGEFTRAFTQDWLSGMSGGFSVLLAVLALYVSSWWEKTLWGALAIIAGVSASYSVWNREREKIEHLAAQLNSSEQNVRDAILDAKRLIGYWLDQASHVAYPPDGNPNPAPLGATSLSSVVDEARRISLECAQHILEAVDELRRARGEFEKLFTAARHQHLAPGLSPALHLMRASGCLNKAIVIVNERTNRDRVYAASKPPR